MAYYASDTRNLPTFNFNLPHIGAQAVGDFNVDGRLDMVVAPVNFGQSTKNEIKILANNETGSFNDVTHTVIEGTVPNLYQARQIVVADFNGDGRDDIFIANQGLDLGASPSPGEPNTLLLSQPDGHLRDVSSTNIPQLSDFSHSVSVADINGDGKLDLFIGNFLSTASYSSSSYGDSYFLINNGAGLFSQDNGRVPASVQLGGSRSIGTSALADFNRDGKLDLFIGTHNVSGGTQSGIYFGDGTGSFANSQFVPIPQVKLGGVLADAVRTVVADMNGDGSPDLIVSYYGSPLSGSTAYQGREVQLLLNDGSGHFNDVTATNLPGSIVDDGSTTPQWAQELVAQDVNHDGYLDIVVESLNSSGAPPTDSPVMWLNDGHAHFTPLFKSNFPNTVGWNGYPSSFGIVDVSGNGNSDLLEIGYRAELLRQVAPLPITSDKGHFGTVWYNANTAAGQVYALYDGLLGRAPDYVGLEYWGARIQGGSSPSALAAQILSSSEAQARSGAADNATFVTQLFNSTLHRTPDDAGLSYWTDVLASGTSRADVGVGFSLSAEHIQNITSALQSGVFQPDAAASQVARIYYAVLDRTPDVNGLTYWTNQIKSGSVLDTVTASFINTPEVQAKTAGLTNAQYVDAIYLNALGRHAEASGLSYWSSLLDQGASRVSVTTTVGESPEAQVHHAPQIELGWHLA